MARIRYLALIVTTRGAGEAVGLTILIELLGEARGLVRLLGTARSWLGCLRGLLGRGRCRRYRYARACDTTVFAHGFGLVCLIYH